MNLNLFKTAKFATTAMFGSAKDRAHWMSCSTRSAVLRTAIIGLTAAGLGTASSPTFARNDEARRMEQEAREMQRQAEQSRREAEKAAKRTEAEARRAEKEAEKRQREEARQAREAERNSKSNSQSSKTESSNKSIPARTEQTTTKDKTNTKTTESKKDDTKEDKKADNDKKDNKENESDDSDDTAAVNAGPPATVQEWLNRLNKPSTTEGDKPNKSPQTDRIAKPDREPQKKVITTETKSTDDKSKSGTETPPALRKPPLPTRSGNGEPIVFPGFRPEILAVNATPQVIDRAKALGFTPASSTSLTSLRLSVTRLSVPSGMSPADAKALLSRDMPKSDFAPNQKYRIYRTAGPSPSQPVGLRAAIPGSKAAQTCDEERCFARDVIGWNSTLAGCAIGVRIGVIDTSVDLSHPALSKKKPVLKHLGRGGAPGPDWHGTGVTALLAGDSTSGTPGLIPDAAFFVADIFYADDDNEPASDTVSMLRAFDWLESKGVKIINMSLSGPPDELIRKAIERLSAKGVILVAAAGNEGPGAGPSYPAAYDQVIAVTAVTKDLQNYRYANRGEYIDLAAPGVAIYTALPGAMEGYHSGTSFATPYVTATLAALYPGLANKTSSEAMRHFQYRDLGAPGPDPIFGLGLVKAPQSCTGSEFVKAPEGVSEPAAIARAANPHKNADTSDLPWLGLRPSGE